MSMIEKTWDIVEQFTTSPLYVTINKDAIIPIAKNVKEFGSEAKSFFTGKPKWFKEILWDQPYHDETYTLIAYELLLDSVNYNYWYGRSEIRPNGASSYEMSKLLDDSFGMGFCLSSTGASYACVLASNCFKNGLATNRYPNLENRVRHIKEVEKLFSRDNNFIPLLMDKINIEEEDAEFTIEYLAKECPGYASDMFLKRAFLFIIEMNRRMGWFKKDIHKIPIPADYHIPKMLHALGGLRYKDSLKRKILNHELIISGSMEECEIRASSIKLCQSIAEEAGTTMADVDTYLFANRKTCSDPFHLTITTDY